MASLGGHWRDSAGNQVPGTSYGAFNFATEISNDSGSLLTKPNDSTIQVGEAMALAGGKGRLFVANIKLDTSHNNRGNFKFKFVLTSGTGTLFSTFHTGYVRSSSNRVTWVRVIGVLVDSSLNAQVQLQWRRSTQSITIATLANVSDLQCYEFHYAGIGIYNDSGENAAYAGTTRNTVTLNTDLVQSDTAKIQRTGNNVAVKTDGARYLIFGSVSGDNGGSRTQRISNIAYGGTAQADTQSYAYQRNSANPYAGMIPMDLYEKPAGADVNVSLQCYRGAGVAANQGGADVDGNWDHLPNECGLCVIELNSDAEVFRSTDGTGGQTLGGSTTTINAMRTVSFNDAASYTSSSNTVMDVESDHLMLCFGSIFTARSNISSGTRGTIGARITIGGTDQSVGEHGTYTRGNQGTQDCFGGSWHPGGFYEVSNTDTIGVETFDAGDNGAGDDTQAGTVGFFAINMDTLEPAAGGTDYTITADAGSYSITGTAADLHQGRNITAEAGSLTISGGDADLDVGYVMSAEGGSLTITGQDANLTVASIYNLDASPGSYTISGQSANLIKDVRMNADGGNIAIAEQDASLIAGMSINAEGGSVTISGSDATLSAQRVLDAAGGSITITGSDATLSVNTGTFIIAGSGAYLITGQDASLTYSPGSTSNSGETIVRLRRRRR